MPLPVVEPRPAFGDDRRPPAPLEAHEASYLAASARMDSLRTSSIAMASRLPHINTVVAVFRQAAALNARAIRPLLRSRRDRGATMKVHGHCHCGAIRYE